MKLRVALLGDLAAFDQGLLSHDWKTGLKNIKEYLENFDLVIANLEVPITNKESTKTLKGIHIKSDERIIEIIKYLGIDAVSLANNHICDFEKEGMLDTLLTLEHENIHYFGVNNRSYEISIKGESLVFFGFCCYSTNGSNYIQKKGQFGVNALTSRNVINSLEYAKNKNCFPILSLHWGEEYTFYPNTNQIEFAHKLAKKYNYVLYGHHTHVMQGIENYSESILAYSLGNFYFDDCQSPINKDLVIKQSNENKESYILELEIENGKAIYRTQGIHYDGYHIMLIDNSNFVKLISNDIRCNKEEEYARKSKEMIERIKSQNLKPHDFKWIMSKLNYHSIGAKIISYYYKHKFKGAYKIYG